jgi:hypothetical protein
MNVEMFVHRWPSKKSMPNKIMSVSASAMFAYEDEVHRHMATYGSNTAPYRSESPFLQSYPWRNGVILEPNSLKTWVSDQKPSDATGVIAYLIEVGDDQLK